MKNIWVLKLVHVNLQCKTSSVNLKWDWVHSNSKLFLRESEQDIENQSTDGELFYHNNHFCPLPFASSVANLRQILLFFFHILQFSFSLLSVQLSSVTQSCSTLCNPMDCSTTGFPVHCQLPELTQTHVHWVSDASQPSHPLSSPSPPAFNLSQHQGLFQWVNSSHELARVLESQLQHQSFQWTPRTDLFRMDWLDLLVVQGTLKSLLQHHSSKESILQRSAFFTVQLSHPYMTIGKTIALTRRTFVGKVMSLLLNMLSKLVITFLPRSKRLLISWLQSPSAVILEPRKIKSATVSTVSPSICHEVVLNLITEVIKVKWQH